MKRSRLHFCIQSVIKLQRTSMDRIFQFSYVLCADIWKQKKIFKKSLLITNLAGSACFWGSCTWLCQAIIFKDWICSSHSCWPRGLTLHFNNTFPACLFVFKPIQCNKTWSCVPLDCSVALPMVPTPERREPGGELTDRNGHTERNFIVRVQRSSPNRKYLQTPVSCVWNYEFHLTKESKK